MAACVITRVATLRNNSVTRRASAPTRRPEPTTFRCSYTSAATSPSKSYSITLLPGDGIGPEVVHVAKDALSLVGTLEGIEFKFREAPVGGAALDLAGVPLPEETLSLARDSDAVLLGAIGGYKWDSNEKDMKPETGLLQLRAGLGVFANLRPATVFSELVDSSTLKREVAEGVDIMVVRELTGGIYFGKPRGFGTTENGEDMGFNTEVYSVSEVSLQPPVLEAPLFTMLWATNIRLSCKMTSHGFWLPFF